MSFANATPVLRVSDYEVAKAFYTEVLGFQTIEEAGEPTGFGIFRAGGAQLFLHAFDGAEAQWDGWRGYFYPRDMAGFVARLTDAGLEFKGPTVTSYGMREVEVTDPDGNVLCFGEDAG